ncbi:hypothetical protein JL721_7685 [Aureococcus anophagefferens]|nr:hypothetical protein JL721_7685 [Aureococcus anophagefferens]
MGNAALSPAPAEAATAAWRAPPAKDKGPRRPPRAPRPSEPKAVREAIPLPADVLPHLFSYSCAREVGTFRFLVSRGASAQLIATAELAPTLADAERRGYCEVASVPAARRGPGPRRAPAERDAPAGGAARLPLPARGPARRRLVLGFFSRRDPGAPRRAPLAPRRRRRAGDRRATVRFYGAASFEEARDYATPGDDGAARWALGRVAFHSYGFVRDAWPPERSPTSFLTNADVGQSLYLPVRRVSAPRRADRQWRDDLCDDAESRYATDDFQHLCVRELDGALRSHGPFAHANDARAPWRVGDGVAARARGGARRPLRLRPAAMTANIGVEHGAAG